MNALQRTFLGVYSLLWIAACTGLVVMAWNSDQKLDLVAGELNIQAFVDASGGVRAAFTAMMFALALVGVATFLLAVMPQSSPRARTLRVRQSDGTETTISAAHIESSLKAELEAYPDIVTATPKVDVRNARVYTTVDVLLDPGASPGYVTGLVNEVVISLLRDRAGIGAFAPPQVQTRFKPERIVSRPEPEAPRPVQFEDEYDPNPFPQIEWESPEPRNVRSDRLTWQTPTSGQPASYPQPGPRDE